MAIQFLFIAFFSGVTAQLSNTTICAGNTITVNCTVASLAHVWEFGDEPQVGISAGTDIDVGTGVIYQRVSVGSTAVVTSATETFLAADQNNTMILCRDGLLLPPQGEQQEAVINLFGNLGSLYTVKPLLSGRLGIRRCP